MRDGLGRPHRIVTQYLALSGCCFCVWLAIMLACLHAVPVLAEPASPQQNVAEEIAQLKQKVQTLQQQQQQKLQQSRSIARDIAQIERDINESHQQSRQLRQQVDDQHRQLDELAARQQQLQQQRELQQQQLGKLIRSSFATGRQEYLKLLLNQESPERLGRLLAYYEYFNQARAEKLDAITQTMAEMQQVEQQIQQGLQALDALQQQQQQRQATLQQQKQQRQGLLTQLKQQIAQDGSQIKGLNKDIQSLEEVLQTVKGTLSEQAFSARHSPFIQLKGLLQWPVTGPILRHSASIQGVSGVIIRANEGSAVQSVHQGRVIFSDWLRGFGLMVIVDHGDDYMTLYGHNSALLKSVGDWVEAGEMIAEVGASGGHSRNGLYFDMRHKGQPMALKGWFK